MLKVKDIRRYLNEHLSDQYPSSELRSFHNWILESLLDYSTADAMMNAEKSLQEETINELERVVQLLAKSKPIQQVFGHAWFYGCKFSVNEHVLIPRPETEELVDWILKDDPNNKSLLDIGTGSGCIPISIAMNSSVNVSSLDISENALLMAKENAKTLKTKIHFIHTDIMSDGVLNHLSQYDIIVSNPPYVLESDKQVMSDNVIKYEPHLALFVPNENALKFYLKISDIACKTLKPGGILYFEIHELKGKEMVELLKNKGFTQIELKQDMQGKDRMIKALWNV